MSLIGVMNVHRKLSEPRVRSYMPAEGNQIEV